MADRTTAQQSILRHKKTGEQITMGPPGDSTTKAFLSGDWELVSTPTKTMEFDPRGTGGRDVSLEPQPRAGRGGQRRGGLPVLQGPQSLRRMANPDQRPAPGTPGAGQLRTGASGRRVDRSDTGEDISEEEWIRRHGGYQSGPPVSTPSSRGMPEYGRYPGSRPWGAGSRSDWAEETYANSPMRRNGGLTEERDDWYPDTPPAGWTQIAPGRWRRDGSGGGPRGAPGQGTAQPRSSPTVTMEKRVGGKRIGTPVDVTSWAEAQKLAGQGYAVNSIANAQNQFMESKDFGGGKMYQDPSTGEWAPLDVIMGNPWSVEQRAAMPEFLKSTGSSDPRFETTPTGERKMKAGMNLANPNQRRDPSVQMQGPGGDSSYASNSGDIDRLIGEGYTPMAPNGQPYKTKGFGGGTMFQDPTTGEWAPGNVILGGQLTDEQRTAMRTPEFRQQFGGRGGRGGGYGGGRGRGGYGNPYSPSGGSQFGSLAEGFNEEFNYPELPLNLVAQPFGERFQSGARFPKYTAGNDLPEFFKSLQTKGEFSSPTQFPGYTPQGQLPGEFQGGRPLSAFSAKTGMPTYAPQGELPAEFAGGPTLPEFQFNEEDLQKDPGYKFRVAEMDRALAAQHSSQANDPMGGKALREIARYRGGLASQEFGAAYGRAQMEHSIKNAKSQEEYDRLVQQYQLKFGRSQEQYGRGVQDVGIQQGLSGEAYNREKEAYASSVAQDESGYQRALMDYDRKMGRSQEEYGRGQQDFQAQYGLSLDQYNRDREAYALSVANNNEEYERALTDFDRQLQLSNEGDRRRRADFGIEQGVATDQYGRDIGEFALRADLDERNKSRISNEYDKGYRRAFGEFGTRFDIDRANKTDIYNRFAGLSGTGQMGAAESGRLGMNFADSSAYISGNNARSLSEIWSGKANAQAAGRVGGANAWGGAWGRIADDIGDIYAGRRTNREVVRTNRRRY